MPEVFRGPRVTDADRPWARRTEQLGVGEFADQLQREWRTVVDELLGWNFRRRHPAVVRFGHPRVDGAMATTYRHPIFDRVEVLVDGGLVTGLHDEIDSRATLPDRWRFVRDVLAHEAVHVALLARYPVTSEDADHVGKYALLADALAPRIGLGDFPVGRHWAWPYLGRTADDYGGAWRPLAERDRHHTFQALIRDLAEEGETA